MQLNLAKVVTYVRIPSLDHLSANPNPNLKFPLLSKSITPKPNYFPFQPYPFL